MLTIVPAALEDLAKLSPSYHPRIFKGLVVQLARSPAISVKDGKRVLAIAGLYPMGNFGELWCHFAPELRDDRGLALAVLEELRRFVRNLPEGVEVVATVRKDHELGFRLARAFGFRRRDELYGGELVRFTLDASRKPLTSARSGNP